MKKKIIFLAIIFILTGCTKYKELNNLSIISNITISTTNNKFYINMQEIIPNKKENSISYTYKYHQSNESNIEDALKKIIKYSSKTIYLKKVQNIIINNDNKEIILKEFITYYNENKKMFNKYTSIVIAKDKISEILKVNSDYKYIDSILKKRKTILKDIKKNSITKIPEIKISNKELIFTRYYKLII